MGGGVQDDGTARTYTNIYGINIDSAEKGTNTTVTNAYGLYITAPTIGGTLNVGAAINGDVLLDMPNAATTNGTCKATAGGLDLESIRDCSGAPSDIAEWYDTTIEVEMGDIVAPSSQSMEFQSSRLQNFYDEHGKLITENAVVPGGTSTVSVLTRSSSSYQQNTLGIVATAPYQTFGEDVQKTASHPQRIALVGRVPVKVSTESGAIKIGDRITSSSLAGVGMKATKDGVTVGIALESFDGSNGVEVEPPPQAQPEVRPLKVGKILVFVNLGYSKLDDSISSLASNDAEAKLGTSLNGFSIDQSSGKVNVNFLGDLNLNGNSILNVSKILGMDGKWSLDESGKLIVKEIETERLKVESGVTTRDRATGGYYCIFVDNGTVKSEKGVCGEGVLSSPPSPEPTPESTATTTATTPSSEASDGTASTSP